MNINLDKLSKEFPLTPISKERNEKNGIDWVCGRCLKTHLSFTDIKYCDNCGQRVDLVNDIQNEDYCVCCGRPIPEGRIVCKECE